MTNEGHTENEIDASAVSKLSSARQQITSQLSRVIVGQEQVIEQLLICLFSRGHC